MTHQRIRVVRLAHVYYQHPNLQTALDFLGDFGFIEQARDGVGKVYLRGYGEQPYIYVAEQSPDDSRHFLGAAWAVETRSDLDIAAGVDSATPIRKNDGPGGGEIVSIKDPNGMFVHFVHGQELRQPVTGSSLPVLEKTVSVSNTVTRKDRKGDFRRFTPGPSPIHKLGHYGYGVPRNNFKLTLNWYLKTLNLKETDSVFNPITGDDETCFLHIDLGDQFTDHHSFFVAATDAPHAFVHHSSYEVNDFDTETLGHDWLLKKGWKNCWGLGRHVLGSQIFDYWFDSSGNIVEHYSDGDLVNKETIATREPASPSSLHVWGPNVPLAFVTGRMEDTGKELVMPSDATQGTPAKFQDAMAI